MKKPRLAYGQLQLDEWLANLPPPIVTTKAKAEADDPFRRLAKAVGFTPPIDQEARLRAMKHKGPGDTAVHQTQLQVTASLLQAGLGEDEVVERVLDATKASTEGRPDWNWDREERGIRGMCASWLKKHPRDMTHATRAPLGATTGENDLHIEDVEEAKAAESKVVNLAQVRAKNEAKTPGGKKSIHIILGEAVLYALLERGEQILYSKGQLWRYQDGLWAPQSLDDEKKFLDREIEVACRALKIPSVNRIINEGRGWIQRNPDLYRDHVDWDAHGKIPTLSGLVDLLTGEVTPLRPEHYATYRIECQYDPEAACPWWEHMLKNCFPDNATIDVIQEVMGTALIENKPRELTRALVYVGPSNSGKSNLLNAMAGFLSDQAITVSFDGLDHAHGLMPFLRRAPWLLHEAFEQSKWHFSATVKALLSGDPVGVNIKNGPFVTHRFRSPVFGGSNSRPQFKESSKAMTKRMIVQPCNMVFSDEKRVGAAMEAYKRGYAGPADLVLATEHSGMLNWALAGLRRAMVRGHFNLTPEMKAILHEIQRDANYIEGFMEDCTEHDEAKRISMANYCAAHGAWWKNQYGDARPMPSNDAIGRALRDLGDPKLQFKKIGSCRYIVGIKLTETGMAWWTAAAFSKNVGFATSKTTNIAEKPEDVEEDATN